jgi:hypothetical protein
MNTPSWMIADKESRTQGPRMPGRRHKDSRPSLETLLGAAVVLAWAWGVFELTLLFLK